MINPPTYLLMWPLLLGLVFLAGVMLHLVRRRQQQEQQRRYEQERQQRRQQQGDRR